MTARLYRRNAGSRLVDLAYRGLTRRRLGKGYRQVLTVRGGRSGRKVSTPVHVIEVGGAGAWWPRTG
jgi:hypothetical protein